jgi:hypothetical protein
MCVVPARRNRGLTGDTAEDEDPGILPGDWFEAFSQETPSDIATAAVTGRFGATRKTGLVI